MNTMSNYDEDYKNNAPYPNKKDFTTIFVYSKGVVLFKGTREEVEQELGKDFGKKYVVEISVDEVDYKKVRDAYYAEENRLYEKFKQDLFEEYEVENNPNREKAFSLAWENGHSSGYSEVAGYFDDYVDLIS